MLIRILKPIFIVFLLLNNYACSQSSSFEYPEAKKIYTETNYHGVTVIDEYQWMENLSDPHLLNWIDRQEKLYGYYMNDKQSLIDELKKELNESNMQDSYYAPMKAGPYLIHTIRESGKNNNKILVSPESNPDQKKELLDFNMLNNDSSTFSLTGNFISPYGKYLAYRQSINQSRYQTIHIMDLNNLNKVSDKINGFFSGRSFIGWDADASGFFYSQYEVPKDLNAPLSRAVFKYHKIGTRQLQDIIVFENVNKPTWVYKGSVTWDGSFLVMQISDPEAIGNAIYIKDLKSKNNDFVKLVNSFDDEYTFLYYEENKLFFKTSAGAPNYRIVSISTKNLSSKEWIEVIPEKDNSIISSNQIGNKLVLLYNQGTKKIFNLHDLNGEFSYSIHSDAPNVFFRDGDRSSKKGYLTIGSVTEPLSVYAVNLETGEKSELSRKELSIESDDYITTHTSFTAKDGTKVPIQLIHHKDIQKDGSNPVFIYGYGSFGWTAFPWQNYMMPWIKRGGIYAIANIRGGGVYGQEWQNAGIRLNRMNSINDFMDASNWLINEGYTSRGNIAVNGGSASGILPAYAINQDPQLFGAAIIDYPVLDMLRYHKFGSANWVSEFGTSDNLDDFSLLYSYSPYHQLKNQKYPPTLVQAGEKDNTITPMHAYKYTAALQSFQESPDNPVLLKISRGAGHSHGATRSDRVQTQAEQLAFLLSIFEMDR